MSEPWISVEERLPAGNDWVLVYCDGDREMFVAYWNGEQEVWYDRDLVYWPDVTHWMPLPAPPNKETE